MDSNKSGRVTSIEIKNAFNNLGINIGAEEAEKLVARIDDDNSLDISFEEWRDYLLFHPSSNMDEIIKYWRRESHLNQGVDHGEDVGTPGERGFCFPCPYFSLLLCTYLFTLSLLLLDVQNFVWKTMSVHTGWPRCRIRGESQKTDLTVLSYSVPFLFYLLASCKFSCDLQ